MVPAIFGLAGPALTDAERSFFADADPAGYILFARNCVDPAQTRALTDALRSLHGRDDVFICIDQEGGRVTRMKPPAWPAFPSAAPFDALYDMAPISAIEATRANAEGLGLMLAAAGITHDALPLLDVRQPGAHDIIGDRALGAEPLRVAALGRAVLDGLGRAGVGGIVKHMPGHGRAGADSHQELPVVTATAQELETDLAPFRALADADVGMSAHVRYTAWDDTAPATLSPIVIERIVRGAIGFSGLLLSDDIDMAALAGPVNERGAGALAAGCDLVVNCWARMTDMEALAATLPAPAEATLARLARAQRPARAADPERLAACIARRDALLATDAAD